MPPASKDSGHKSISYMRIGVPHFFLYAMAGLAIMIGDRPIVKIQSKRSFNFFATRERVVIPNAMYDPFFSWMLKSTNDMNPVNGLFTILFFGIAGIVMSFWVIRNAR